MRPVSDAQPRPDLAEVLRRKAMLADDARPEAVARRHEAGRLTVRECLERVLDPGSLVEYGGLALAAQRSRRSMDELLARTPGDGVVGGIGKVDGTSVAVLSYDYLVLAGTQGMVGHKKTDRLLAVVVRLGLPLLLIAEGGGGRPGDTDVPMVGGLDLGTFRAFAGLPTWKVGVTGGFCFAGNAALFGMCDVTIAVAGASIGMGGPAMISGGGLGEVAPEDVGPVEVHLASGVLDAVAPDDAAAMALGRRALSFALPPPGAWTAPDQALLRDVVPENRRRAYDVHRAVELLADDGSVFELAPRHARGMVTALARIEGRPLGVLANNPLHLAGAITAECADKAARFLELCARHGWPVLSLCDTPGIMVGPDAEKAGLVRAAGRLFRAGAADLRSVCVVLRKGYGLGAMAMAGGSFHAPLATLAWPSGEFGGMGLEGAVRLGLRRELAAIDDPDERQRAYDAAVAAAYAHGSALSTATYVEIDDVIDPADTRALVAALLWA